MTTTIDGEKESILGKLALLEEEIMTTGRKTTSLLEGMTTTQDLSPLEETTMIIGRRATILTNL